MSAPITTLIVDDEPLARETLATLLAKDPDIQTIRACGDGATALAATRELRPELVFLDIQMPRMGGLGYLKALAADMEPDRLPFVVLVTAYDQYAIQAFEHHALDYLLKPFKDSRFYQALAHAKKQVRARRAGDLHLRLAAFLEKGDGAAEAFADKLAIKVDGKMLFVPKGEIEWLEAADHYVEVHGKHRRLLCRGPLSKLERQLDPKQFLRVHRSAIVNAACIAEIGVSIGDERTLTLTNGQALTVSRRRWRRIKTYLDR